MGAKLVGVLMMIAGVVILLFGFSYVNSPQYKMMSLVNGVTGASDPTGQIAMIAGGILSFVGFIVMLSRGRKRQGE